jgi:hypothetical protein
MLTNLDGATHPIIEILDMPSPAVPRLIASANLPGMAGWFAPTSNGVLLSHRKGLLAVTQDGTDLARTAAIRQGSSRPSFVITSGTCATWSHGVVGMLDIIDPFAPVVRGRFPVTPNETGYGIPLAFRDGWAYRGLNNGLEVYDTCDPDATAPVQERVPRWGFRDIAFSGDRLHFVDELVQLHVTEVIDPTTPRRVGVTSGIAHGDRVALDGDPAYVAGQSWSWYDRGMLSIDDASVPALMPVIGSLSLVGPPVGLGGCPAPGRSPRPTTRSTTSASGC